MRPAARLSCKLGSPHDVSKIVRQQSVLVSKALRREVEGGLGQGIPGICRRKPDQGATGRSCNSLTFSTFWLRVRFWTNRVMTQ
jgi:hypothetical protein